MEVANETLLLGNPPPDGVTVEKTEDVMQVWLLFNLALFCLLFICRISKKVTFCIKVTFPDSSSVYVKVSLN